jgi:hypothetical protein
MSFSIIVFYFALSGNLPAPQPQLPYNAETSQFRGQTIFTGWNFGMLLFKGLAARKRLFLVLYPDGVQLNFTIYDKSFPLRGGWTNVWSFLRWHEA